MEVAPLLDLATYFAKRVAEILGPERIPLHLLVNRASYVHYVPRGVVGVIGPWNFPLVIPIGEAVMAMLAGNAAVVKPSEVTPLVALRAKEIFDRSGMPRDLLQIVTGRGDTGGALIDSGIDYCAFTGSTTTGRRVAAACGERLIPCTLELGGKARRSSARMRTSIAPRGRSPGARSPTAGRCAHPSSGCTSTRPCTTSFRCGWSRALAGCGRATRRRVPRSTSGR